MSKVNHESSNENDDDNCSMEGRKWTLETTSSIDTIGDGNAKENESNSINALQEVPKPFPLY
jgi:hypothetical protein